MPGLVPEPPPLPVAQRRQHARLEIRMSAEIKASSGTFTATTRDISEGGIGLEADRLIKEGELLTVGLFLVVDDVEEERTPPLWVKARVMWAGESDNGTYTAGLRFEVISPAQKTWLRNVLARLGGLAKA